MRGEWGGQRPGSGRPPKAAGEARVDLSCRVHPSTLARLREIATAQGIGLGQAIDLIAGGHGYSADGSPGA